MIPVSCERKEVERGASSFLKKSFERVEIKREEGSCMCEEEKKKENWIIAEDLLN